MKLNVKTDLRVFLAKVNFSIVTWIIICIAFYFYHNELDIPSFMSFFPGILTGAFDIIFQRKVYLNNSYLYLKQRREEPSPLKDIPIKPENISGYHLNNPFPEFSKWCDSSENITLCAFLFFLYLFNSASLPKYGISYLIFSGICLTYSLIYIVSGIILWRRVQVE